MMSNFDQCFLGGILLMAVAGIGSLAAWFTHVYVCLVAEAWGFLIAGALFAPIGMIHGFLIWLGVV